MSYNHGDMVRFAAMYLNRTCKIVTTEIGGPCGETPDAIGRHQMGGSVLIECKTSIGDFIVDKVKPFRKNPGLGMGKYRIYMTPRGLIPKDAVPSRWGLIEVHNGRYRSIVKPNVFDEYNSVSENKVLVSCIRRMPAENIIKHISVMYYEIHNPKAKATLGVVPDAD